MRAISIGLGDDDEDDDSDEVSCELFDGSCDEERACCFGCFWFLFLAMVEPP
ncbi:hypothetical protein [Streptomyces sp. NPDC090445]|uniref:hypothetical protein n=1 Tax=Streptomyces sp. NPDC090445 TaxID=3365963 RepID=UPI0037FAFD98